MDYQRAYRTAEELYDAASLGFLKLPQGVPLKDIEQMRQALAVAASTARAGISHPQEPFEHRTNSAVDRDQNGVPAQVTETSPECQPEAPKPSKTAP